MSLPSIAEIQQKAIAAIKQKALDTYNNALEKAKDIVISLVKTKIKEISDYIKTSLKIPQILKFFETIKLVIQKAKSIYEASKAAAALAKAAAFGTTQTIIEAIKQAAIKYKNEKLGISEIEIDLGVSNKIQVLASVDPSVAPDKNTESGLILTTDGAKVKLNSIKELVDVVKIVNNKLKTEDLATTLTWVHKMKRLHPLVDSQIKDLEFFKPVSNEIGATYLQHTPDTATLALEDWDTAIPNPFRRSLENKIGGEYERIRNNYQKLNQALTRNLSTEFYYESPETAQKSQAFNFLNKSLLSNDYRIAGDFTFAEDHVGRLENILMSAFVAYVGGAGRLINWTSKLNTFDEAINSGFAITVEGKDVVVDLKGNKVGVIASVIDTKPISVKGEK